MEWISWKINYFSRDPVEHPDTVASKVGQLFMLAGLGLVYLFMLFNQNLLSRLLSFELDIDSFVLSMASLSLLFIALVLWVADWMMDSVLSKQTLKTSKFIAVYSFGSFFNAGLAVAAAFILIGFMVFMSGAGSNLFFGSASYADKLISFDSAGQFFFIVDSAPIVEETFRWAWIPALASLLSLLLYKQFGLGLLAGRWVGFLAAAVLVNSLFAVFHGWVLESDASMSMLAALWGIGMFFSVMNFVFSSMMFSLTFHYLNNLFVFVRDRGVPVDLPGWLVGINVLIFGVLIMFMVVGFLVWVRNVRGGNRNEV